MKDLSYIKNLSSDDIRNLTYEKAIQILNEYTPIAKKQVRDVRKFFESRGIELPQNFSETDVFHQRSWSNYKFDYPKNDRTKINLLKNKVSTLTKFFNSSLTSVEGYKKFIKDFRAGILKQAGIDPASTRFNSYKAWAEKANTYWRIYEKVQNMIGGDDRYYSARVQTLISNEWKSVGARNEDDLVSKIFERFEDEYRENKKREANSSEKLTQRSFLNIGDND